MGSPSPFPSTSPHACITGVLCIVPLALPVPKPMLGFTAHFCSLPPCPPWLPRPMQGLLRARGFDLADEHRCLLVSLSDCAPEQLPEGSKPLPPEFAKRKLVNFSTGSCMKLRWA